MFLNAPSHPWVNLKIALTVSTQPAQSTRRLGCWASRPQRLGWPPTAQSHVLIDFPFDSTVIFLGILDSTGLLTIVLQSLVSWFLLFEQLTSCWIAACHTVVLQSCELGAVIAFVDKKCVHPTLPAGTVGHFTVIWECELRLLAFAGIFEST